MGKQSQEESPLLQGPKVALEIEWTYNLSTAQWRDLYNKHCSNGTCPIHHDYGMFRQMVIDKLAESDILYKRPHTDGGGVEVSLLPFTEIEYWKNREKILSLIDTAKEFLLYPSEKDGIHINIDLSVFTVPVLKRFLHVIGPLSDFKPFMAEFIGRPGSADKLGNIDRLLGTMHAEPSLTKNLWERYVEAMIEGIGTQYCTLNLCFNKNSRPILEWRWFGSSIDPSRIFALVEFTFSILEFKGTTLKEWVAQVKRQRLTRSYILKELRKYPSTKKYLGIHNYI